MTRIVVAAGLAALLFSPAFAAGQTPSPAAPAPPPSEAARPPADSGERAHVEGFRGAHWGMTEAQVKEAVRADFKIAPDKLKAEENLAERTTVLTIVVPDLLDGAGNARVSYILGYTTKKLIQVNIVWGTPIDAQAKPERVVAAANQLRQLFLDSGYEAGTVVSNARAADGEIIVFQGQDADKHTTQLRLVTTPAPPKSGKENKEGKETGTTALFLSYVMDSRAPDIFRLKKGQF